MEEIRGYDYYQQKVLLFHRILSRIDDGLNISDIVRLEYPDASEPVNKQSCYKEILRLVHTLLRDGYIKKLKGKGQYELVKQDIIRFERLKTK